MSIVHPVLVGARVLDLFAGTGALGLESLSRGAAFVDFVEFLPRTIQALDDNISVLGARERCAVHRADAIAFCPISVDMNSAVCAARCHMPTSPWLLPPPIPWSSRHTALACSDPCPSTPSLTAIFPIPAKLH